MLYLGIDQHRAQLTVNIRDEQGDVVLKRQVSTEWDRVRKFFEDLRQRAEPVGGFMAIVEICGFNDWLLEMLNDYGCRETVLIQPEKRSRKKTDRRDASALSQLLWVNRQRVLGGKRVQGLKRIILPSQEEQGNRQLTALRQRTAALRTRTINKVQHILLKHNLQQECPTKGMKTKKARQWLTELPLGEVDRLEMDQLLSRWELWDVQIAKIDAKIQERQQKHKTAPILATLPGCERLQQLGPGLADRRDRELPASRQPGQLLGPDAWLPQFRRCDRSTGVDHQGGKCDGPIHSGATGCTCVTARCVDESVVCADQEASRVEDCPGGRDASVGDDHLAHG